MTDIIDQHSRMAGVVTLVVKENLLTNDEIRVLSLLRRAVSLGFASLEVQVQNGRPVSAQIVEKVKL